MKKLSIIVAMFLMVSMVTAYAATAKKAPAARPSPITISATVSHKDVSGKKVVILETDNGVEYEVTGAEAAKFAKLDGKKVKVTGFVKSSGGEQIMSVRKYSIVK